MIGTIFVTKRIYEFFHMYVTRMIIMAVGFAAVCSLAMAIVPDYVQHLFYGSNINREDVIFQLDTIWWVIVPTHIINALLVMFQGILFCFATFKQVAYITIFAAIFGYIPLVVSGAIFKSLFLFVLGNAAFATIRVMIFVMYYFMKLRYGIVDV